jgi:hypothetical protein
MLRKTLRHVFKVAIILIALASSPAYCDLPVSSDEFKNLAADLAPKVNLFADAWKQDPNAEFVGGTVRDYLYWLKGQFRGITTADQAKAKIDELRKLPSIDVRDFIIGDSDVDVASINLSLSPSTYGVRKIDMIGSDRFDPSTQMGHSEAKQGFIPVEKIRLGRRGFTPWPGMGDGIHEIYSGKPTVHFASPEDFHSTHFAKLKLNHEVLLAIRYVRTLAINYYREHGRGYPDPKVLLDIDPESKKAVQNAVNHALVDKDLAECMSNKRFKTWLDQLIQKSFRSYTNPTAAYQLFEHFKLDELVRAYSNKLEPINQYLFAQNRDPHAIEANMQKAGTSPEKLFTPVLKEFPDQKLYHGTRTETAFNSILLQGILPSSAGTADGGLYGVRKDNIKFAEKWGGSRDRIVTFRVKPTATVVDVTQGEGQRVFAQYRGDYDRFAQDFGVDVIRYPYDTRAYVVKNSAALERPQGFTREIMTFSQVMQLAKNAKSEEDIEKCIAAVSVSSFNDRELHFLIEKIPALGAYRSLLLNPNYPVSARAAGMSLISEAKKLNRSASASPPLSKRQLKEATQSFRSKMNILHSQLEFTHDPWKTDFLKEQSELLSKEFKSVSSVELAKTAILNEIKSRRQYPTRTIRAITRALLAIGPGKGMAAAIFAGSYMAAVSDDRDPTNNYIFSAMIAGIGHFMFDRNLYGPKKVYDRTYALRRKSFKEFSESQLRELERHATVIQNGANCVADSVSIKLD